MWILLESATPSDMESIEASFNKDVSDEKYSPTEEFLRVAYRKFNDEFFGNELPSLEFRVKSKPSQRFVGLASYECNLLKRTITPIAITLNSSRTMTLHEWLEVVLHEMVHIYDYVNNPEHFVGWSSRGYDAHGEWFLGFGSKFEKYGFHVQKFCKADYGINTDDKNVKKQMSNNLFIVFGTDCVVKISNASVEKVVELLANRRHTDLTFYKSENPKIVKLQSFRPRNVYSTLRYYHFNDKFKDIYGPFTEIEPPIQTIAAESESMEGEDYMKRISEDNDETEFDDMNRIDDDYAKKIYDGIKGVVDVKQKSKDEFIVDIA